MYIKRALRSISLSNYSQLFPATNGLDDPWFPSHVGNALRNAAFTAII